MEKIKIIAYLLSLIAIGINSALLSSRGYGTNTATHWISWGCVVLAYFTGRILG